MELRKLCHWGAAARDLELVDAAQESLRRGRQVQVHEMQYTEQQVFRGLMSALGCGLLMVSVVILTLGAALGTRFAAWTSWWPAALLVLLVGFLLLQLLQFLSQSSE